MAVNTSAAYGMYPEDIALAPIVQTLSQSGFGKEDICMMVSPSHPMATIVREASVFNAGRESSSRIMSWLLEFGAVVIPTVGFFIRSQAFFRALLAVQDSPVLCGSSKTLVGLGFSESEAVRFEEQVRDMGVLVYVACGEAAKAASAVEVLRQTGAKGPAMLEKEAAFGAAA